MAAANPKLSIQEKLDKAKEYKDSGNVLYKEGKHKAAAGKYHRAILYLKVGRMEYTYNHKTDCPH